MRHVMFVLAILAVVLLTIIQVLENGYNFIYNLFHRTKRRICWNLLDGLHEGGGE